MKRLATLVVCIYACCAVLAQQSHIYAVLLSGGRSRLYNHERYWNDCSFLYRTLRHDYHIPQSNITLIMGDGDNTAKDMMLNDGRGFASSPTDLDGDGQKDLTLAATVQNLNKTVQDLKGRITPNDHLFIFITDHAEPTPTGDVQLWLWGGETLTAPQLATLLSPLQPASLCILMAQCYAGAFVNYLQGEGRVVTAACAADELSWACPDRPYDEFVYHWTCAVARHDEKGNPIDADYNDDGRVTMDEAYRYAREHDRRQETPGMTATPTELSAQWSFDGLSPDASIRGTSISGEKGNKRIYDLQGRQIHPATSGNIRRAKKTQATQTIYIVNGKLIYYKH